MLTPQDRRAIKDIVIDVLEVGKDELLNTKQCAEQLGISEKALRQRCQKNTIPFHKKHGFLYFLKNEIMKYYTREG